MKKWDLFLHLYKNYINILFFIIFFSCAAISPPSGGPEDETPPELISSFPESGTLLFKGNKIELKFSEYIDENSIANAFSISPKLDDEMKVIYDNKEILIELPANLLEDQTYVISISSKLKDERGVFLGSILFASDPTKPYALGYPGFDEKSSISLFIRIPVSDGIMPEPYAVFRV